MAAGPGREAREFATAAIYRSEARTPPATGYALNPRESLHLFLAGIAEVRECCAEFASFLGVPADAAVTWCNAPVPTAAECDAPSVQWPLPQLKYSNKDPSKNPSEPMRSCDAKLRVDHPSGVPMKCLAVRMAAAAAVALTFAAPAFSADALECEPAESAQPGECGNVKTFSPDTLAALTPYDTLHLIVDVATVDSIKFGADHSQSRWGAARTA